jgi:hypothetical protein
MIGEARIDELAIALSNFEKLPDVFPVTCHMLGIYQAPVSTGQAQR